MESLALSLQPDPSRLTLAALLADAARRHGPSVALRFEGRSIRYEELELEARRLARALVGAGVVKGARVALCMGNRPEWVVAAFATALVGGVLVPLSTFATPDERDWMLRHSDASLLLTQARLLGRAFASELTSAHPALAQSRPGRLRLPALPQLRRVLVHGLAAPRGAIEPWSALEPLAADVADELIAATAAEVHPADDALIIYTSGTTDRPKGVVHAQRAPAIQSYRFAEYMGLGPEDRVWTAYPFFWTAGIAMSLGATLAAGAALVLQETFEPAGALALIESERVTAVHAWPHQEKALADHPDAQKRDLRSIRRVEFASPLAKLARIAEDRWGIHAAYGASETFTIASALPASTPPELRRATHGRPLPGTELRVVDPASGAPLPAGARGEIALRGATRMRGYYKLDPERAFDADGWYRTGDEGWLDDDGQLHWTGRLSTMVKTGGANVSPLEVETALRDYHGLRAAAAVGVPHPTLGEALVLCAVPVTHADRDEAKIREFLRERLAPYKVPRRVLFFEEGELPLTGNQKIEIAALRDAALGRLAAELAVIEGHDYATTH